MRVKTIKLYGVVLSTPSPPDGNRVKPWLNPFSFIPSLPIFLSKFRRKECLLFCFINVVSLVCNDLFVRSSVCHIHCLLYPVFFMPVCMSSVCYVFFSLCPVFVLSRHFKPKTHQTSGKENRAVNYTTNKNAFSIIRLGFLSF